MKLIVRNNIATFVNERDSLFNNFEDKLITEDGTLHMTKTKLILNMETFTQEQTKLLDDE